MQFYNTPIMYNYDVKNNYINSQTNFKGVKSLSSVKDGHGIEYGMRILGNKFNDFFTTKGQKQLTQNIANIENNLVGFVGKSVYEAIHVA